MPEVQSQFTPERQAPLLKQIEYEAGQEVSLGNQNYTIVEKIGSGAVVDAYRIKPAGMKTELALRVTKLEGDQEKINLRIKATKKEGEVISVLNKAEGLDLSQTPSLPGRVQRIQETAEKRTIIALVSDGNTPEGIPYTIQELAPSRLERKEIKTIEDERQVLEAMLQVAKAMELAHQKGIALQDFEPETKGDRIRGHWATDGKPENIKLIDFNVSGGPEKFPQDLLYLGGHIYYFLTGAHVALDAENRSPITLGVGVAAWRNLSEGSRQIIQKALHRKPESRYQKISEIRTDLEWWIDALSQVGQPNAVNQLQDRFWQAKSAEKHNQVLALTDLALRIPIISSEEKRMFELWTKLAREELDKERWLPLADARVSLLSGAFATARQKFETISAQTEPSEPLAHWANLLALDAGVAERLKKEKDALLESNPSYQKASSEKKREMADIRPDPGYQKVRLATDALLKVNYTEAVNQLNLLETTAPELVKWPEVEQLASVARAGLLYEQVVQRLERRPVEAAKTPSSQELTRQIIDHYTNIIEPLRKAASLANTDPFIRETLITQQTTGLEQVWQPFFHSLGQETKAIEELWTKAQGVADRDEAEKILENTLSKITACKSRLSSLVPPETEKLDSWQQQVGLKLTELEVFETRIQERRASVSGKALAAEEKRRADALEEELRILATHARNLTEGRQIADEEHMRALGSAQQEIEALEEENERLRDELAEIKHQQKAREIQEQTIGGPDIRQILEENEVLKAQVVALKAQLDKKTGK